MVERETWWDSGGFSGDQPGQSLAHMRTYPHSDLEPPGEQPCVGAVGKFSYDRIRKSGARADAGPSLFDWSVFEGGDQLGRFFEYGDELVVGCAWIGPVIFHR